jgi:hypothetical protein
MRLQQPIDRSLRDKVLLLVGEAHSQPPRRQLRNLQCQRDDLAADIIGNVIPDTIWSGTVVSQRLRPASRYRGLSSIGGFPRNSRCDSWEVNLIRS